MEARAGPCSGGFPIDWREFPPLRALAVEVILDLEYRRPGVGPRSAAFSAQTGVVNAQSWACLCQRVSRWFARIFTDDNMRKNDNALD